MSEPAASENSGAGVGAEAHGGSTEITGTVNRYSEPRVSYENLESKHDRKSEPVAVRSYVLFCILADSFQHSLFGHSSIGRWT